VLAEFGDGGDESIIGGSIEEDCVVDFILDFSLGPFLGATLLGGGSLGDGFLALLFNSLGHVV